MMASAASLSTSLSIPPTLSETLANLKTPWLVSSPVFGRMQSACASGSYKKCEITDKDPEWAFVHRYFDHQRPTNRSIARIYCVHNPVASKQFEAQIENSEAEARNPIHVPKWQKEDPAGLRKKVHERWQAITAPFSGFALDARHSDVKQTKILPLWHGTSAVVCHSVCKTGFTDFGKHHLVSGGSEGAGKVVDMGYFGSGLYFTTSARYAAEIYSDGNLLLAWVSMREPFPVVADKICTPPNEPKDMKTLKGLGHYQGYNAHYIPVISVDPTNPKCAIYYPCAKGQTPAWDEIVVFNKPQTLVRFWLELQVDLAKTPSSPKATVELLLEKVLDLLESDQVQQDENIFNLLEKKSKMLVVLDQQGALSAEDQEFFVWTQKLLDQAGKVRSFVTKQLSALQVDKNEPKQAPAQMPAPPRPTAAKPPQALFSALQVEPKKAPAAIYPSPGAPATAPSSKALLPKATPVAPMAFGKAKWEQYIGEIGDEPPLPANIEAILNSPCPFWEGKKIKDTHLLTLIPETVNGKPLTLKSLGELVKTPKQGHGTQYRKTYFGDHGDRPAGPSHWVLMTKDVLPESRKKSYDDQQKLVQTYSAKSKIAYQVPNLLDAATAIFMEYITSRTRLYNDAPWTFTLCLEKVGECQMAVGGFAPDGLCVDSHFTVGGIGVGCLRKF